MNEYLPAGNKFNIEVNDTINNETTQDEHDVIHVNEDDLTYLDTLWHQLRGMKIKEDVIWKLIHYSRNSMKNLKLHHQFINIDKYKQSNHRLISYMYTFSLIDFLSIIENTSVNTVKIRPSEGTCALLRIRTKYNTKQFNINAETGSVVNKITIISV